MPGRLIPCLIALLVLAEVSVAQETPTAPRGPMSLAACVDHALEHNPKTRAAYLAAQSAQTDISVAMGAYLPTADLGVDAGTSGILGGAGATADPGFGTTARLTLSYLIFDGSRQGTLDGARARLDAASLHERATLLDVALDVEEAWLGLQGALWTREAVEDLILQADYQQRLAAARFEVGLARKYDVVQARATLREVEIQRTTAATGVTRARGDLARAMGVDLRTAPEIVPLSETAVAEVLPAVDRLIDDALAHRPELGQARAGIAEALAATRVARAAHLPTISADASLAGTWDTRGDLTGPWAVGVGLNLPLFRGLRTTHTIRGAEFDEARARAELADAITDVQFEVWAAHAAAVDAAATAEAMAALLEAAEEAVALAEADYKAGTGTIGEVLVAQAGRANARLGLLQTRLNRLLSVSRLQRAVGRVLSKKPTTTGETGGRP
ncbi:MAG: TolC family protein [Pseudomonadota bacterium]